MFEKEFLWFSWGFRGLNKNIRGIPSTGVSIHLSGIHGFPWDSKSLSIVFRQSTGTQWGPMRVFEAFLEAFLQSSREADEVSEVFS